MFVRTSLGTLLRLRPKIEAFECWHLKLNYNTTPMPPKEKNKSYSFLSINLCLIKPAIIIVLFYLKKLVKLLKLNISKLVKNEK